MLAIMLNVGNNVTSDQKDDLPGRLYEKNRRKGKDCLFRVFVENIGSGVVAEFEIHFLLSWIFLTIEVGV